MKELSDNPTTSFAADALSVAIAQSNTEIAQSLATRILASPAWLPAGLRLTAEQVLGIAQLEEHKPASLTDPQELHARIRELRRYTHLSPRNAFVWVDIARVYETLGQFLQADRCMDIALRIAPHNRFVLRSAARQFARRNQPDRARSLLARSGGLTSDPWLLASEVALATMMGQSSRHMGRARRFLENQSFSPRHLAELAAATGTHELVAGADKRGRRFVRQGMVDPNENTIAQAAYLARTFGGLAFYPFELGFEPVSPEADALSSYHAGNWDEATVHGESWLIDQPFSSRPAALMSHLMALHHGDFTRSATIARAGLMANPTDFLLYNNLVFALACGGKTDEAQLWVDRRAIPPSPRHAAVWKATQGLVAFRQGKQEVGRALYSLAVREFESQGLQTDRCLALMYWAQEELRVASHPPDWIDGALRESETSKDQVTLRLNAKVRQMLPTANTPPQNDKTLFSQ